MASSLFKTPYSTDTPKSYKNMKLNTPMKFRSDSEESLASTGSECGTSGEVSDSQLSILAEYDEVSRFTKTLISRIKYLEKSYAGTVENAKLLCEGFRNGQKECLSLQERLEAMAQSNRDLEEKLKVARLIIDKEKKNTKNVEKERDKLILQMATVKELVLCNKETRRVISEDTLGKINFLDADLIDLEQAPHLSCIPEVNSTGSIISEFSISKSEDDLDTSIIRKTWKKHGPSAGFAPPQPAMKKRRSSGNKVVEISSSDTVRATTTLSLPKHGPITATSVIEAVPFAPSAPSLSTAYAPSAPFPDTPQSLKSSESYNQFHHEQGTLPVDMVLQSWARKEAPPKPSRTRLDRMGEAFTHEPNNNINNQKQHLFQKKTVVLPETCVVCLKRLGFGRFAWKCRDCKNLCHEECREKLPMPCIPVVHTPNQRNGMGLISDYTGTTPPLVPPLIVHCINEIEARDSKEVGLYRVPGSERDVKSLKERFLKGKAAPCLKDVDVHVLCGVIKAFLRSLPEPLITRAFWRHFVTATENNDAQKIMDKISELPQPNRDTLAFMMVHFNKIAEKKEIKMDSDNISKVFGPTIIGYSTEDIDNKDVLISETRHNINVMKLLLTFPKSYWESFVYVNQNYGLTRLQQTPSTDSLLLRPTKTPNKNQGAATKRRRFFPTPPDYKRY